MKLIKNPTKRKVKNRGFTPVRYRTTNGVYNGWIVKRGRKYMTIYLVAAGKKKVPLIEERYMQEIT